MVSNCSNRYNRAMATTTQPVQILGKPVAEQLLDTCRLRVGRVRDTTGVTPCLAAVLVGDAPASQKYVERKSKLCKDVGMRSVMLTLPATMTTDELVRQITELADDSTVHGILLQHPVPDQIDERAAFEAIPAAKDVDGVTYNSFGAMTFESGSAAGGFDSCTPGGIMQLLRHHEVEIKGKHAVVIGRSAILGKPMAMLLLAAHATVTICHSRTTDLADIVQLGDIVVAAVGKPAFIKGDWVKPGAVVIDAGFNHGPKGNVGDVDYDACARRAAMITPVPGGVGPMTLAVLMDQTSIAAARQLGVPA